MIDKDKRYRTPKGEIVTGAELVEVPPVRTAEDVVRERISATLVRNGHSSKMASIVAGAAVHALREAGWLKEPDTRPLGVAEIDGMLKRTASPVYAGSGSISNKPDPEGWIAHDGGPCPVDGEARVDLIVDGSGRVVRNADVRGWNWSRVTYYRVVSE